MGRDQSIERVLPQSLDAEVALLGSLMIDSRAVGDVLTSLGPDSFYRPDHQEVYNAVVALYDRNEPVDVVLLREELLARGATGEVCELDFLTSLTDKVPSAANAAYYARLVREKAVSRSLIAACNSIVSKCYHPDVEPDSLLDEAEHEIFVLAEKRGLTEAVPIAELLQGAFDLIDQGEEHKPRGLPTGFVDLDDKTGGLHGSQLIIIAGRPSMGKTSIACNIMTHIAVNEKRPVALFSLEMSKEQIAHNLLCSHARVPVTKLMRGFLDGDDTTRLVNAAGALSESPIYIDDPAGMTILELKAKARRLKRRHKVEMIIIDYLQLMAGSARRVENRQQEISQISRELKMLAKELDIPVIAVAQLSRAVESREGNVPRMSDLRESGSLEQDADLVLLVFREDYYAPEKRPGEADLYVAKQRSGPTGKIALFFKQEIMRFENFTSNPAYSQ